MKKADAIRAVGSVAALARELKVSVQAVYKWPDVMPEPRAYELRGRRPDLFPPKWPDQRRPEDVVKAA